MDKYNNEFNLEKDESKDKKNNIESTNNNWRVVDSTEEKNSNVFELFGIIAVTIIILAGMTWGGMKLYDFSQSKFINKSENNNNILNNDQSSEASTSEEESSTITVSEERMIEINEYVHHMANTIILAVDGKINGIKQINMETIDEALSMVKNVDWYLYKEISKWRDGDFSNGVEVHNYVWKNLDGEIGKANGLDEEAIESIKNNL